MKLHPIQNTFSSGILSPRMLGRSDTQTYAQGLLRCENMVVDARGPVRNRSGTRFGFHVASDCARVESFQVDRDAAFSMVFTNLTMTLTTLTAVLPAVNLITNPNFVDGSTGWTEIDIGGGSNVEFNTGSVTIDAGNAGSAVAGISQSIGMSDGDQPHEIYVSTFGTDTYNIRIGSAPGLDDIFSDTSNEVLFVGSFTPGPAGAVTVWIEVIVVSGAQVTVGNISVPSSTATLALATPWPCDVLDDLYFVQVPGGRATYILNREYQPQKLEFDTVTGIFTLTPVTFQDAGATPPVTAPPEWVTGNYPGVGAVFQGRLWLMSTVNERETMWGSRAGGAYEVFFIEDATQLIASDAILGLPMERYGRIEWAIASKNLVVGTSNGEYIITSSDGLLRPTDISINRQSAYGSAGIQPLQVTDKILYVSADQRKIRVMSYERASSNWVSEDLTFIAEHLTEPRIKDIAWAPNPDNILYCTLEDGDVVAATYERGEDVLAWHLHTTEGVFHDLAISEISGVSVVTFLVQRVVDTFEYEILAPAQHQAPLDSYVHKNEVAPFTVVDGLDHIEGYTVQILADGGVRPSQVVTGGIVTLARPALDVFVGIGFDTTVTTLPFDKGAQTGSGAVHMKRFNKILVRLLNSAKPIINDDRPPTRNPSTPMDTPELPRTEDVQVINLGWDRTALITVTQDLPLPLTIVALLGELGQEIL